VRFVVGTRIGTARNRGDLVLAYSCVVGLYFNSNRNPLHLVEAHFPQPMDGETLSDLAALSQPTKERKHRSLEPAGSPGRAL
jgi:hypothetical protein